MLKLFTIRSFASSHLLFQASGLFCDSDTALKIAFIGHVDHGKSTLLGRLLLETNSLAKGKIADLKNIGGDAGSITAGLFLQEFVPENTPWAHLDIAGTAFTTKPWKYYNWGATGWGVRSLVNLVEEFATTKKN